MSISKKLRFEVFKRDGFQCQYCGKTPPEIVLEIDHIKPRKKKGQDNIENLITACFDCNRGKGATELKTAPPKTEERVKILKEKREQLKAFNRLQERIYTEIQEQIIKLCIKWEEYSQSEEHLTDHGKNQIKNLLRTFTFFEVQEAMEIAWSKPYLKDRFAYMCGILWTKKRQRENNVE